MNLYTNLASAKDELRRAKDHEQTIRAIVESTAEISGKTTDDRKRELAFALTQNPVHKEAQADLRDAEYAVDMAQAAIDQAETERRDREWSIRARLADALSRQHIESEDAVPDWLATKRAEAHIKAHIEMDELFTK